MYNIMKNRYHFLHAICLFCKRAYIYRGTKPEESFWMRIQESFLPSFPFFHLLHWLMSVKKWRTFDWLSFSSLKLAFSSLTANVEPTKRISKPPLLILCNVKLAQKRFLRVMVLKNCRNKVRTRVDQKSVNRISSKNQPSAK